jgi:uncharacterized membrane protein
MTIYVVTKLMDILEFIYKNMIKYTIKPKSIYTNEIKYNTFDYIYAITVLIMIATMIISIIIKNVCNRN